MSSFLKSVLHERGRAFWCDLNFDTNYADIELTNGANKISTVAKIDTGCFYTIIPLSTALSVKTNALTDLKMNDICNDVEYIRSYGIESGTNRGAIDDSIEGMMKDKAITFYHQAYNMKLSGYDIGNQTVRISYDRTGNVLIGMDILSKMLVIADVDRRTYKYTLMACLKSNIASEFRKEVYDAFNIILN